jgi:hypothetical protein
MSPEDRMTKSKESSTPVKSSRNHGIEKKERIIFSNLQNRELKRKSLVKRNH